MVWGSALPRMASCFAGNFGFVGLFMLENLLGKQEEELAVDER